jgi:hypothetical protein
VHLVGFIIRKITRKEYKIKVHGCQMNQFKISGSVYGI